MYKAIVLSFSFEAIRGHKWSLEFIRGHPKVKYSVIYAIFYCLGYYLSFDMHNAIVYLSFSFEVKRGH